MRTLQTEEDFPPLPNQQPKNQNVQNNLDQLFYKRFIVIKNKNDGDDRVASIDPWSVNKQLKPHLGNPDTHHWRITPLRAGSLLVEVSHENQTKRIFKTKRIKGIEVVVEMHNSLNSSRGKIYCNTLRGLTNDHIKEKMVNEDKLDVLDVYRIVKKNSTTNTETPTDDFIITFAKPNLPPMIQVGYQNLKVKLSIPNPRRCFKCQKYRHGINTCTANSVCAKCGTECGNSYKDCENDAHCLHCNKDHPCTSQSCPMFILEKKIVEENVRNRLTFPEAEKKVYFNNMDLVRQCPGVTYEPPNNSYSIAASASPQISLPNLETVVSKVVRPILEKQDIKIASISSEVSAVVKALNDLTLSIRESSILGQQSQHHQIPPSANSQVSQQLFSQYIPSSTISQMDVEASSSKRKPSTDVDELERAQRRRRGRSSSFSSSHNSSTSEVGSDASGLGEMADDKVVKANNQEDQASISGVSDSAEQESQDCSLPAEQSTPSDPPMKEVSHRKKDQPPPLPPPPKDRILKNVIPSSEHVDSSPRHEEKRSPVRTRGRGRISGRQVSPQRSRSRSPHEEVKEDETPLDLTRSELIDLTKPKPTKSPTEKKTLGLFKSIVGKKPKS